MRLLSKLILPLYTFGLFAWFLTWFTINEAFWPMVLINRYIVYLFAALPIAIVLCWQQSRKTQLRINLFLLLVIAWFYWPYALPQTIGTPSAGLRVMTYNVLYSNTDVNALETVIQSQPVDIVALQEVTTAQWAPLSTALQERFPYEHYGVENDYGTNAVLSRYPIESVALLAEDIDRPILAVKLNIAGQPFTVYATHIQAYGWRWLPRDNFSASVHARTAQQLQQVEAILTHAATLDHPHIVLCDCNSRELSSAYRLLTGHFSNAAHAYQTQAATYGTRKDRDIRHIDYILLSEGLTSEGVFVVQEDGGSDHQARVGVISFP